MSFDGARWTVATVATVALLLLAPAAARGGGEEIARALAGNQPTVVEPRPDLVARLDGPVSAQPGETIAKGGIRLTVTNTGTTTAWGTRRHPVGFMVDVTLGRDALVVVGFKAYSPHFAEDVLLEGGRVSKTDDLAPAATQTYRVVAVIPGDAPAGRYYLCAFVDPGNAIAESDERNNAICSPLRVVPAAAASTPRTDGATQGADPRGTEAERGVTSKGPASERSGDSTGGNDEDHP